MAKVVYNKDFGGFGLSDAALALGQAMTKNPEWSEWGLPRHDATLVFVVETLGLKRAGGEHSCLDIREIPDGARYRIQEYDGSEQVILASEQSWIKAE